MASPIVANAIQKPVTSALVVLTLTLTVWFLVKLTSYRLFFHRLQAQGMPMPPHNIILGHLPVLIRAVGMLPSDAHLMYLTTQIRHLYPKLGPDFYLDVWPFAPSLLVVGSPETMHQISFEHVLKKTSVLKKYLYPLTDGYDIVSMDGAPWKKWRGIFNPGFSASHLMTLIPIIVKETEVYCEVLDEHVAKQDIFAMKSLTDNLILDVIGQVALGLHFNCQKTFNKVIHSLRMQIKWLTTGAESNFFNRYHPMRPFVHWYHGRVVNDYVTKELNKRFEAWQKNSSEDNSVNLKSTRTVIDLALNAYAESQQQQQQQQPAAANKGSDNNNNNNNQNGEAIIMDPFFKKMCLSQLKVFLFSGHDTTSSAICFHLWLLSQNPECLTKIRAEHTSLFGPDPLDASKKISTTPHLLNQLPYTTAVIKESLRLFPTVTTSRTGESNFSITDNQGRHFPTTANLMIWPNQHSTHHDPKYWPDVEKFLPDRWLVGPDHPLYPIKGIWRPFEQGPRACIAQELAMLEMKIVLVLVCRRYNFLPAYEEDSEEVLGQKAYQVDLMQPRGDLPVRVEFLSS